jgi:hypothetical protein
MGVVQQISSSNRSQTGLGTRYLIQAPKVLDSEIPFECALWKQELKTYFPNYKCKFERNDPKISLVEGIFKDKA